MTPTKRKIISAYTSLLNEKSKAKITITDIVHRAQTSRTTFYHYFSGLENLNNECIDTAIDDINHILNKNLLFNIPILTEMLDYICYFQSLKNTCQISMSRSQNLLKQLLETQISLILKNS
ncbi:TetR/AcrR family transcriptional regulator [Streptococcus pluranimalium]|uniref:TetR/AcrR family transcriptional regulator n=1 Tax=Streptococcus pluranimalium TaxID=82348 RepID=UPI003F68CBAC